LTILHPFQMDCQNKPKMKLFSPPPMFQFHLANRELSLDLLLNLQVLAAQKDLVPLLYGYVSKILFQIYSYQNSNKMECYILLINTDYSEPMPSVLIL